MRSSRRSGPRFGPRLVPLAAYAGILLFNAYSLFLYSEGQLTLYIHPRYVLFTVILNLVSALACGAGFALTAWRVATSPDASAATHEAWRPTVTLLAVGLVLVAAYALPARTLSSSTADQRADNFNAVRAGPTADPGASGNATLALFGADTSRLTIEDWVSSFGLKSSPDLYVGKDVDLVGFVYDPRGTPQDVFYIARFRVTCCAVDAQPLGVPVRSPGWRERFAKDSWVRVTGSFAETDLDVAEPAVVEPRDIEPVRQPKDPYIVD